MPQTLTVPEQVAGKRKIRQNGRSLSDRIRELALSKGPEGKLPTTRELCSKLETNPVALNMVLRELEAQSVIYRKDRSGIYVSPKIYHKSIAITFAHRTPTLLFDSPFWTQLLELVLAGALERTPLKQHEYTVHLIPFGASREESVSRRNFEDQLLSGSLNGVLTVMPDHSLEEILIRSGIPVVGYALGPDYGWGIGYDPLEQFRLGREQLMRHGCRKIAVISFPHLGEPVKSEIVELCRTTDPPLTIIPQPDLNASDGENNNAQDIGWHLAREIFGSTGAFKPDGLIFMDDMLADGAIKALFDMGLRPGEDVQIASLANVGSPVLRRFENRLILIESDPAMIVAKMFETLDDVLSPQPPPREYVHIPWRVRVYGSVVERE